MTATVRAKPFNAMVRSMKKIVCQGDPRPACRRIHLKLFESAPGTWHLRAEASDAYRVAEDTVEVLEILASGGIGAAEINPPRLAAKGPVRIEMLEDRTVVSFDDVSFTTMRQECDQDVICGTARDPIAPFLDEVKTRIASKPGRLSVTCNAKYLLEAAEAMRDAKQVRIDAGAPTDPIILAGQDEYARLVRVILPIRAGTDDAAYREQLAKTVVPAAARDETEPKGGQQDG